MPAARAARAAAADRMRGGSGVSARRTVLPMDVEQRTREAAADIITGVRRDANDSELLLDWGLNSTSVAAVEREVTRYRSAGSELLTALMTTAEARKQAAVAVAPAEAETPIVVGSEQVLPTAVAEMTKEERHRLATKWGTARYSEAQKSAKKLSYRKVYVEGVALFGKDAMPNRSVLQERVMAGEIGTSPNRRGRPKTVDDCITEQLLLFNAVLRESKIAVYKSTVITQFKTLITDTGLMRKFIHEDGEWNEKKIDNWYQRHFLASEGVSTGHQRPIDVHREQWKTAANCKIYFDDASDALQWAGIAYETGAPPFVLTEDHLKLSEDDFRRVVLDHPPELEYHVEKAHLALSLDECKLLLATHDDTHRRAERTLRIGKDDDGAVLSAKSACALSGMGGSHASFERARPGFVFASDTLDPGWIVGAPKARVHGVCFDVPYYENNTKGSFTGELFLDFLKHSFVPVIQRSGPDSRAVLIGDGVQSHLTLENLRFMVQNNIRFVPRPPYTSDETQNEDLVTFHVLRNHKTCGYNKLKQERLVHVALNETPRRTSLNFTDAMPCVEPGWTIATSEENNARAWRAGGLRPFTRLPQRLFELREAKKAKRSAAAVASALRSGRRGPDDLTRMNDADFLNWTKVLATAPTVAKRGRQADGEEEEEEGGEGESADGGAGSLTCRLGASAIFNTVHEKRGHLAAFHSDVRDVKGMDKENLSKFLKAIAEKDSTFNESYPGTKDLAKLKIIDWLGAQYGFLDEKTGEVANSILQWWRNAKHDGRLFRRQLIVF